MLKKATEADCSTEVIKRLRERLDELIITRPLEDNETDQAREYLKQSCRDFVVAATKGGGRPVVMLNLDSGAKIPASLVLDPPLQCLTVRQDIADAPPDKEATVSSLSAVAAKDDK